MNLYSVKKYLLILLGSLSLAFGVAGIFIPVLPTTPFLLLASFCYLRSSKRMYYWLINHKILGAYIYCYITYKAVPMKTKAGTIVFLWATLILSMLLTSSLHIRLFLLAVGIGVSCHLILLKTLKPEDMKTVNKSIRNACEEQTASSK